LARPAPLGDAHNDRTDMTGSSTTARGAAAVGALPVLYSKPVALSAERHGNMRLARKIDFGFAKNVNAVPLNVSEIKLAVRFYPIVFAGNDPVTTLVILGVRENTNLFVSDAGEWEPEHYVPAYIRRYPFIFMTDPATKKYLLCVDEDSSLLRASGDQTLFVDGKPSAPVQRALSFCSAYQSQSEQTREFAQAIQEAGLLVPNRAEITLPSGEKLAMGGFSVIDEEKFAELPDAVFLDWRKRGWLPLIYYHMLSASNWALLVQRSGRI